MLKKVAAAAGWSTSIDPGSSTPMLERGCRRPDRGDTGCRALTFSLFGLFSINWRVCIAPAICVWFQREL
jgi:hypothetical protein